MNNVDVTGDNLGVFINCEPHPCDEWMAFACWYSILKNLPDAKVAVGYTLGKATMNLFTWTYKYKVRLAAHTSSNIDLIAKNVFKSEKISNMLVVKPWTMAVRVYNEQSMGPIDVKNSEIATFVSYENGCAGFITPECINKVMAPFSHAVKRFANIDMTANEKKVLELWERADALYKSL